MVAPYAGAWIEIAAILNRWEESAVAPYAGAWIEIGTLTFGSSAVGVAPSHGARGLKSGSCFRLRSWSWSRPHAGRVD